MYVVNSVAISHLKTDMKANQDVLESTLNNILDEIKNEDEEIADVSVPDVDGVVKNGEYDVNIDVSGTALSCSGTEYCRKGICVAAQTPNEFNCANNMICDAGNVCRNGVCVSEATAINEYGCNPAMTCDAGQVCRNGLCVASASASDRYGCHPGMVCDSGQVCRDGVCIIESKACIIN